MYTHIVTYIYIYIYKTTYIYIYIYIYMAICMTSGAVYAGVVVRVREVSMSPSPACSVVS